MIEKTTHEARSSRVCSLAVETVFLYWTRPPRCGGVRGTQPKLPAESLGGTMASAVALLRLPLTPVLGFTLPPGAVQRRSTTSVGRARLGHASSGTAHRSYGAALAAHTAFLPASPRYRNARTLFRWPRQRIKSYSWRPVRQYRYLGMEHSDQAAASPSHDQRPAESVTGAPIREQLPRRQRATVLSALTRPSAYRDGLVLLLLVVLAYALASTTTNAIMQRYDPSKVTISSDPKVLPVYGFQSVMRLLVAYGISLVFSMIYAYIAYRASFAAQMLLLIIDVLQSVPILAFVPAAVLGLIAMFPGQRLGVELAAILLLFTSMAWNMLLGFYQSLISIPPDLMEAARVLRLSAWRRFWLLEAPAGVCSLVWNSIISVSSGWFFLISIESFSLGPGREYRLPGLGSFLSEAADRGNMGAVSAGLLTVVGLIVCIDFLFWRPLIVWSERFKFSFNTNASVGAIGALQKGVSRGGTSSSPKLGADVSSTTEQSSAKRSTSAPRKFGVLQLLQRQNETEPARNATGLGTSHAIEDDAATLAEQGVIQQRELDSPRSIVFAYFQRSPLMRTLRQRFCSPLWQKFLDADRLWERTTRGTSGTLVLAWKRMNQPRLVLRIWNLAVYFMTISSVLLISGAAFVSFRVANHALRILHAISLQSWMMILGCAMFTFARVLIALVLSLLWTVPLGVAIGCSPALARVLQPLVQIAASVPATAVFPFLLLGLANLGGLGLQVGSILLMMLGTMWYILFNVIAGSAAIPTELWEADAIYNKASNPWPVRQWKRWRYLILPGIFPYLITGIVTAVGGAWNASIVSEYVQFRGKILSTRGLGALISDAAARGDMPMLLAGTLVMAGLVLLTNRFVWAPLYKLARERYTLN
ncbi:hypothetical protein CCYA_CCYA04G1379 [Cyanidiococcus yangmingshanensis]|nr:hypothetical protein CCYA_CCYA04G1379 [Cyanidiococcus yangmingshanensis]